LLPEARHVWLEELHGGVICTLQLMDGHGVGEMVVRNGRLCIERNDCGLCFTTRGVRP
jgi:hypothetical protein